ncbi:MAG: Na+/H+ antiporter NhaC family protein [Bacilli bacterium]|nr:Na+/H+ antiporter NhaC family protein [Bacilli bacterium]
MTEDRIIKINKRSFITVCAILVFFMIISYVLTFIIPKGYYDENLYYIPIDGNGYSFWKFIASPILALASSGGLNIIVISLFLLILGGSFNVIDKTKGINSIISYLIEKFKNKRYLLIYSVILVFMLFGSLFGIFEESVTLLPIIVLLALAMGWDSFTGLSMCLLAAGFGFSTAITNPFSVGLGSNEMGINLVDGIWFRIIIFIFMYFILCLFTTIHVKKIEKNPKSSPTYDADQERLKKFNFNDTFSFSNKKALKTYLIFFISLLFIIIFSSIIPSLQGLSIPIIAIAFLFGIFICGLSLKYSFKDIGKMFFSGLVAISPAVIMLMLAGSIKYILDEGQIMSTIIYNLTEMLEGTSPIIGILFIYLIILVIQFFIGSASAKVILIIPIIAIMADKLEISRNIALLAFIFGDGYTDLIYPTNPVLLISLGMISFSYTKWIKKTFVLQLIVLAITVLLLILGYYLGY